MTINERVDYFTTILMHKIINKSCPDYLQRNFEYVKCKHKSAVNGNLSIPKLSTKTGQRSFLYRGVHAWNSLSVDARAYSLDKLKKIKPGIIFRFFPFFLLNF